jgi:hypothetical protein
MAALGCIATMWRQSKASGFGHVFFCLGENDLDGRQRRLRRDYR